MDVPEPGAGEVLIKVAGAGACRSDLHLMEWPPGTFEFPLPFTLGHENAGWVEALGPGVEGFDVGDAVAVYGPWGCGRCRACRRSQENFCENAAQLGALGGGLGRDGGFAPYMLIPSARLLVPLGDLYPVEAAPLSDAGLTPYHAIKRNLRKLVPGTSVSVVIGVGGLGHMAVQILRAISAAQVIAADIDEGKLGTGPARPALTRWSAPAMRRRRRSVTSPAGWGATVVLDFVGTDATMATRGRYRVPGRRGDRGRPGRRAPSCSGSARCPLTARSPSPTGAARWS